MADRDCWRCGTMNGPLHADPLVRGEGLRLCANCVLDREDLRLRFETYGTRITIAVPEGDG